MPRGNARTKCPEEMPKGNSWRKCPEEMPGGGMPGGFLSGFGKKSYPKKVCATKSSVGFP